MLALVTGASGGIGGALAHEIAAKAVKDGLRLHLVLAGRNKEKLEAVSASITKVETSLAVLDATVQDDVDKLASHCRDLDLPLVLVCLAHGEFLWDTDARFKDASEAREHLCAVNFRSRVSVVEALLPLLSEVPRAEILVVGSQAGAPGFVEAIEAREGKGAADSEAGYVEAMQRMRAYVARGGVPGEQKGGGGGGDSGGSRGGDGGGGGGSSGGGGITSSGSTSSSIGNSKSKSTAGNVWMSLVEPGLVSTASAKREFAHIVGEDWSGIESPRDYARSVVAGRDTVAAAGSGNGSVSGGACAGGSGRAHERTSAPSSWFSAELVVVTAKVAI